MRSESTGPNSDSLGTLANHELVTLAVYLCGGALRPVDTENVAVAAYRLAPGRFSWRLHPDQINLDAVRKRLWDAQSSELGHGRVAGSERKGWMLTPSGKAFCQANLALVEGAAHDTVRRLSADEHRWAVREKARLLDCPATAKVASGEVATVTSREVEQFFRIDDYVRGDARARRVDRLVILLGEDVDVGAAIRALAPLVGKE